ncbi:MAG: hypothetical protein ACRD6N_01630, partial [Pyrinomonadaceae bacterium]
VRLTGELLTSTRLPEGKANAVEAKQAELPAEPQIPVGRLCHREDGAEIEAVPGGPRGMRVLADLQRRVERENAGVRGE